MDDTKLMSEAVMRIRKKKKQYLKKKKHLTFECTQIELWEGFNKTPAPLPIQGDYYTLLALYKWSDMGMEGMEWRGMEKARR